MTSSRGTNLDWLLNELVRQLAGVRHTVVLSTDGLLLGQSTAMSREDAEHLCALASALQGLARSTSRRFGGGAVRQTVVELDDAMLFVTTAGTNACLALLADDSADLGMIAYELNQTVKRVGAVLATASRVPADRHPGSGVP
ncbi:roadblock/LC7 domain-containing protein [Nocardia sp. alder85J]|uniref:roadblock/LC7 domain-containing protein n=1 Tax=Nocardia sp. alder85J TaxID=2862949 RepID=UPI001CD71901|nr:roadblock/LC7 domain-containing protein [Nocardia sp. alder85J]MCX4095652.1 roadblock/LC7 domain-containing protein [Nocardia sp. alder85J]